MVLIFICGIILHPGCKKSDKPVLFAEGSFPDTVLNMSDINSQYDDFNVDCYELSGNSPFIFSSNRKSSGGQFDLEQGEFSFVFDQSSGAFGFGSGMTNDAFLSKIIQTATTPGNDFGPYRFFSSLDGYEYLVLTSVNYQGNLDMNYFRNRPVYSTNLPEVTGPDPVSLFNTGSDDAYFCLDTNQDSAYFTSDRNGNFDIFVHTRPAETEFPAWFNTGFTNSSVLDIVNSTFHDKCPMIFKKYMIFTSNRPGGLGGFDLYYSQFREGKWSSPINLGPGINTSSDEYRPVVGYHPDFTNNFLMFSSNRPGGKGGFDLYFTGVEFED